MVREERGGGLCCLCFSGARIQAQASTYYKKDICHVDCSDSRVLANLNYKLAKKVYVTKKGGRVRSIWPSIELLLKTQSAETFKFFL